jgi:hypothetical protein
MPTLQHDSSAVQVRDYGLGPRRWRLLPGGAAGPDGHTTTLMVANIDPIGRLSVVTQGTSGSRGTWRGMSTAAALRRLRVGIDAAAWYVEHEPSKARDHLTLPGNDVLFSGLGMQASITGEGSNTAYLARTSFSFGSVRHDGFGSARRLAASAELRARLSMRLGPLNGSATAGIMTEIGDTDRDAWRRAIGTATLAIGASRYQVRGDWSRGSVTASSS